MLHIPIHFLQLKSSVGYYDRSISPWRQNCCRKVPKKNRRHMGCRHSSVEQSAPTILPPRVRIPSKPSKLLFHLQSNLCYICHCIVKRTKINKKRPGLAHLKKMQLIIKENTRLLRKGTQHYTAYLLLILNKQVLTGQKRWSSVE